MNEVNIKVKKGRVDRRYPEFDLIPTSHLLDSVWLKKDKTELKIIFSTGQMLEFRALKDNEESL